jgi:hypothetical protein
LRDEAHRRRDRATAAELDRFRAEAQRIAWARLDLESYLNALISAGELRGEWEADRPYVRKAAAPKKLAAADQAVEDLYVDSDIGQVFTLNLGSEGETPNAGGDALQVYQAVDGEAGVVAVSESDGSVGSDGSEEDAEEAAVQEPATETEEVAPEPAEDQEAVEAAPVVIDPAPETSETPVTAKPQDPSKTPSSSPVNPPKPPPIG